MYCDVLCTYNIIGAQQDIGMHSVAPVLPHRNQPQHTAVTGAPVHPQKTEGNSHKTTTTQNTTTSSPMTSTTGPPVTSTVVASTKEQGMRNHLHSVYKKFKITIDYWTFNQKWMHAKVFNTFSLLNQQFICP